MSNRRTNHPDRVFTGRGMVNDIEANLLKVCIKSFEENEGLKSKLNCFPRVAKTGNPNRLFSSTDFPALFVWCDGWKPYTPNIGSMGSKEMTQHMGFYCNIEYVVPLITDEESDSMMKEIGWLLFEDITKNQNLYDLINGNTELVEVITGADLKFIGEVITQVSNVNIKIIFPYTRRTKMTTRY